LEPDPETIARQFDRRSVRVEVFALDRPKEQVSSPAPPLLPPRVALPPDPPLFPPLAEADTLVFGPEAIEAEVDAR
jgi:hypothetical protein